VHAVQSTAAPRGGARRDPPRSGGPRGRGRPARRPGSARQPRLDHLRPRRLKPGVVAGRQRHLALPRSWAHRRGKARRRRRRRAPREDCGGHRDRFRADAARCRGSVARQPVDQPRGHYLQDRPGTPADHRRRCRWRRDGAGLHLARGEGDGLSARHAAARQGRAVGRRTGRRSATRTGDRDRVQRRGREGGASRRHRRRDRAAAGRPLLHRGRAARRGRAAYRLRRARPRHDRDRAGQARLPGR
jgi:hypothetical protein